MSFAAHREQARSSSWPPSVRRPAVRPGTKVHGPSNRLDRPPKLNQAVAQLQGISRATLRSPSCGPCDGPGLTRAAVASRRGG